MLHICKFYLVKKDKYRFDTVENCWSCCKFVVPPIFHSLAHFTVYVVLQITVMLTRINFCLIKVAYFFFLLAHQRNTVACIGCISKTKWCSRSTYQLSKFIFYKFIQKVNVHTKENNSLECITKIASVHTQGGLSFFSFLTYLIDFISSVMA